MILEIDRNSAWQGQRVQRTAAHKTSTPEMENHPVCAVCHLSAKDEASFSSRAHDFEVQFLLEFGARVGRPRFGHVAARVIPRADS